MKEYTKVLKLSLQSRFPNVKFSVKLYPCFNYALSSDRIEIKYKAGEVDKEELMDYLRAKTDNITITDHYGAYTKKIGSEEGAIFNPKEQVWVDADMVEFIVVKEL